MSESTSRWGMTASSEADFMWVLCWVLLLLLLFFLLFECCRCDPGCSEDFLKTSTSISFGVFLSSFTLHSYLFLFVPGLRSALEHDPWWCGGDGDDSGDWWGDLWRTLQGATSFSFQSRCPFGLRCWWSIVALVWV